MFNDIKKEFFSLKILTVLLTLAVSIYLLNFVFDFLKNFSDIIWILILGWLVSFILEPFVDIFTKYLKLPRGVSTVVVFLLAAGLIALSFMIFIPDLAVQFKSLQKVVPQILKDYPPQLQHGVNKFIGDLSESRDLLPSLTQFFVNLVTILILSFYLVVDKKNINRKIYAIAPIRYHEQIRFIQKVIDSSFASFVRIQALWGLVGGVVTYIFLTIFGVHFAASTSLLAGILTAVPMIGPIIGVIPPLIVAVLDKPDQALIIFLAIFLTQQFIFNVIGPKVIGKAFNVNPIMVIFSLLIGIKVAGFLGAVLAIPVISILLVAGQEFYTYYFKEKESKLDVK
jgi:predicted PurR-regulated permease PerM